MHLQESGQGTEFLKRLQEIENQEEQHDDFNQEVEYRYRYIYICI